MSDAAFQVLPLDDGLAELRFDLPGESVNKFNAVALASLEAAVDELRAQQGLRGVLITSGKDVFCVGADITEFLAHFKKSEAELTAWILETDAVFSALEDLDAPSVVAINGVGVGGGFELCLTASYRAIAQSAQVGLPEVKLGLFPGWGGTVRLSRLCGADTAIEWIAGGEQWSATDALKAGAVDAVVAPGDLREAALGMLRGAAEGTLDWKARRAEKTAPLKLNAIEAGMVFATSKAFVAGKAGPHYPAPLAAIEVIEQGAGKGRDEALAIEAKGFAKIARTSTAHALVSVFLGDQAVKRIAKKHAKAARPVKRAAVLGAGIMGGGIAYQSASKGVPVLMKDVAAKALEAGVAEATKLVEKQVERGKLTTGRMAQVAGGDHADALVRRLRFRRLRRRGGGRERGRQEEGAGRGRGAPAPARDPRHQHLDDLGHAAGDGTRAAGELLRDALLQSRAADAARRGDPGREVERGGRRHDGRLRAGARQDPDRGQGLRRLPRQPRAVSLFRRLRAAARGRSRLRAHRQADGGVGLADGTGAADRRRRHRHLRARRQGPRRRLPGPHAPPGPERDSGDGRGRTARARRAARASTPGSPRRRGPRASRATPRRRRSWALSPGRKPT